MNQAEFHDWQDQDRVVLEAVYVAERENRFLDAPDFPDFAPGQANIAFQRLRDDGLIHGRFAPDSAYARGAMVLGSLQVTPKGLRLLGMWPSEDYSERLIEQLDRMAATESDPVRQSAAKRASAAIREFTMEFGARATAETFLRMQ